MDEDWGLLATEIKAARKARRMTQKDLAAAADIGFSTLQRLEAGQPFTTWPPSVDRVARVFGWTPESPRQILAGGKPTFADASAGTRPARDRSLPARVEQALAEGDLVDSEVLELPGGLNIVVVGKSVGPRSPEEQAELADALREWTRRQRKIRGIAEGE
ncbi:helix-turn-helix transcriptional regulator [Streptomyces sp. CC208A]|uniref:helix-turn-helix domain-containing protein n=1 Tax=Streptomyces sp. CC208A TaxID=3044573 RepID=UPI0024A7F0FE|nr:helix-turn-helix transcriptional regulator [Streptomyces sp. CC208A]